ncbi:MAG: DUF58 domain-containing protein [Longimicrobiales bacterium]
MTAFSWFRRSARPDLPPSPPAGNGRRGPGVPREIIKQVRLIELRTRGLVNALFGGEYQSVFRGQGMEFSEVREYQAGDDVRHIDWNVTARMAHPYVKKHVEERELSVLLAVDLSGSEQFATRGKFKAEVAAEIAAVLALSAVRNNDRVGLVIFSDRIEHVVPPRKGRRHAMRLIRDVLAFRPSGRGTDLAGGVDYAARLLPHRGILFVLSDFLPQYTTVFEAGSVAVAWERTLRVVSRRHDVVAVRIADTAELALPDLGLLVFIDPESGEEVAVRTDKPSLRSEYKDAVTREDAEITRLFRRLGVDQIDVRTDAPIVRPLLYFFRRRERKLRR